MVDRLSAETIIILNRHRDAIAVIHCVFVCDQPPQKLFQEARSQSQRKGWSAQRLKAKRPTQESCVDMCIDMCTDMCLDVGVDLKAPTDRVANSGIFNALLPPFNAVAAG